MAGRFCKFTILCFSIFFLLIFFQGTAQRKPVLSQIDLPHSYYFREMYLPRLTSGPSSADWTADGSSLVFSMAGSLWIQYLNSESAQQLTDDDGYDYQPDVSPDGKSVAFVRYTGYAMELMLLDLQSGKASALTTDKFVNLEPRWSPDGKSLAFVSTRGTGHFLIYTAEVSNGQLGNLKCRTPDRKSQVKRYYYSAWDHGLHPVWTPDGKSLIFVSNREVAHGTGDLVKMDLSSGEISTLLKEETNWRLSPDISPDGSRIIYSSYAGRNFNQLWSVPAGGGYPLPFTIGEYDNFSPRWSPDGKSVLMISNREGNTALWVLDVFSGAQQMVRTPQMTYLNPRQPLKLEIRDERGVVVPARVSITDSRGKFYAPAQEWIQADDAVFTALQKFEYHYFHTSGQPELSVPNDKLLITVSHGPRYEVIKLNVDATKPVIGPVKIVLKPFVIPTGFGPFHSADLHLHMNYGGNYLNTPQRLLKQAAAEDVQYLFNLIVNKEQRVPDASRFTTESVVSPSGNAMMMYGQEFHTSFWGHLGLLNLSNNLITPGFAGYPYTSVASIFPDNNTVIRSARAQGGLSGYVHPFEVSEVIPVPAAGLTNQLPVSAALGLVDYYELIGFSDHRASEFVWHQLLNCGLRIPAGAGTDLMGNYSSLRGPVGLNRVVVQGSGPLNRNTLLEKIKSGKSFVTNGPLIGFSVSGKLPGDIISIPDAGTTLSYTAFLRSQIPVDFLEVIWNGKVVATHVLTDTKRFADVQGKVKVSGPGWLVLRTGSNNAQADLLDLYPFATTNPVYVESQSQKLYVSKESAAWFVPWVQGIRQAVTSFSDFRSEAERKQILEDVRLALEFYENHAGPPPTKKK